MKACTHIYDAIISSNKLTLINKGNALIEKSYFCGFGKNGFSYKKIEGDGKTPIGKWKLGRVFYRADKIKKPKTALEVVQIEKNMGWCDDINSPMYNQLITFPTNFSAEKLYRDDNVYNIVVEIEYNYRPISRSAGSAIFFHIAKENYAPTEGCITLSIKDMYGALELLTKESDFIIEPPNAQTSER